MRQKVHLRVTGAGYLLDVGDAQATGGILNGLTESQRNAVMSDEEPLCVIAPAGSGKTRVLTRRVARRILDGTADAERVMVVTFTRKAAAELHQRLERLGAGQVVAGTFHALAYGEIRRRWADNDERPARLVDGPSKLVAKLVAKHVAKLVEDTHGDDLVASISSEISWAQARLVDPASYPEAARAALRKGPEPEMVAEIYERYVEMKVRHRVMDMDDLLVCAAEQLENDRSSAERFRWRFRHLFVDEFQDVNPAQWRLLRVWLGGRRDLFVVGDPHQAIYSWNGADPSLIRRLPELLPGTSVINLETNHRCSPQILAAASAVLGTAFIAPGPSLVSAETSSGPCLPSLVSAETPFASPHRSLVSAETPSEPCLPSLVSAETSEPPASSGERDAATTPTSDALVDVKTERPDGPAPIVGSFEDEDVEAASVVRWLRRLHRPGTSWSGMAVLARTNGRLGAVVRALESFGIPFRIASEKPDAGAGSRAVASSLANIPRRRPLRPSIADVLLSTGSDRQAKAGALRLRALADELLSEDAGATVGDFLAWLTVNVGEDDEIRPSQAGTRPHGAAPQDPAPERVRAERLPTEQFAGEDAEKGYVAVSTFHRSKGLEWRVVAVIGLEAGMVPIAYAVGPEAEDEEKRLLHVALTRARSDLWCSWAEKRRVGGRVWNCEASPFLDVIERSIGRSDARYDCGQLLSRVSELKSRLAAAAG